MSTRRFDELWQEKAACRGPHAAVFFPPGAPAERKDEREAREQRAKAICATCHVSGPCLDYAMKIGETHGVWGGLNEAERKQLAAERVG